MKQHQHALRIEREFDAGPSRLFQAWTTPSLLEQWIWASLGRNTKAVVDLRVGGEYRIETDAPETESTNEHTRWSMRGTYEVIEPDRQLAFTLQWDAPMGYGESLERITVWWQPANEGDAPATRMIFVHEGLPIAEAVAPHEQGWNEAFDFLNRRLARMTP